MRSVNKLPDAYNKDVSGNISKLLDVLDFGFEILDTNLDGITAAQDLNTASGDALDLYAAAEGLTRGALSDDELRFKIQLQIAVDSSSGTADDILTLFSSFLKVPVNKLSITEGDRIITINGITLDDLGNVRYTPDQIQDFAGRLTAAGVGLSPIIFGKTSVIEFISDMDFYETAVPQAGQYQAGQRIPW